MIRTTYTDLKEKRMYLKRGGIGTGAMNFTGKSKKW
jgi:hypothetical protein